MPAKSKKAKAGATNVGIRWNAKQAAAMHEDEHDPMNGEFLLLPALPSIRIQLQAHHMAVLSHKRRETTSGCASKEGSRNRMVRPLT